ncbi:MAG: hypothetical protein DYH12_28920 [Sorangiineae bacterium PRO1]|nr:hypothetical protein [Sorangiineae bacterium PRO1]
MDVSQYRLALHLTVAFVILALVVWLAFELARPEGESATTRGALSDSRSVARRFCPPTRLGCESLRATLSSRSATSSADCVRASRSFTRQLSASSASSASSRGTFCPSGACGTLTMASISAL